MPVSVSMQGAIEKASRSPLLWTLAVVDAMKHFRIKHDGIKAAKALALEQRPETVARAMRKASVQDRFERSVRTERRHPGLHRRLATGAERNAELGRVYDLTRVRVGQIRDELVAVAADRGVAMLTAASAIEDEVASLDSKPG